MLPAKRLVGSDVAHAVPLTLIGGSSLARQCRRPKALAGPTSPAYPEVRDADVLRMLGLAGFGVAIGLWAAYALYNK